ncbi:MAG: hypothetical protein MJZ72_10195, partial [Bacteroidales bacterium]|nr:hypothetical protein [Bacteroidales bacterium]
MDNIVKIDTQMEQEFAHVDSIINSHTNSAIAKLNAEALQTYWEVEQLELTEFVQSQTAKIA